MVGQLYNYLLLLLLIATDMHHYILRAVVDSYKLIPVNEQVFQWDHLFQSFLTYMTDLFVIAFRILPIFAVMMILNCIFGNYGKSCTADEHVCHRYADEDPWTRIFNYVFDHSGISNFVFKEMKNDRIDL